MPLVYGLIRLGNECVRVRLQELRVVRWQGIDEAGGWDLSLSRLTLEADGGKLGR